MDDRRVSETGVCIRDFCMQTFLHTRTHARARTRAEAVHGSTRKHIPTTDLGLKIDGEYLSHLRFADDILICANTPHELQHMLKELADESENQGLKMNKSKTKVMIENNTPIYMNNT